MRRGLSLSLSLWKVQADIIYYSQNPSVVHNINMWDEVTAEADPAPACDSTGGGCVVKEGGGRGAACTVFNNRTLL